MRFKKMVLPAAALGAAAMMVIPVEQTEAFSLLGFTLPLTQRDFRVFNNFTDATANNNQVPQDHFPGHQGAVMAIWKGGIEWGNIHGTGTGDPSQPGGLGSGGGNYDGTFQGEHNSVGGINDNVYSEVGSCQSGVLAYVESPGSNGWRSRFCASWLWEDGPGPTINGIDIQGVGCHEHGHTIGLGHSNVPGSTMFPSISGSGVGARSIAPDDSAGVQAAYGAVGPDKPTITEVCVSGNTITVTGTNFTATGNEIWFTNLNNNNGVPPKATGLTSDGTIVAANIPGNAGPGDVLVRKSGGGGGALSNPWPSDLQPGGELCAGSCPTPANYCVTSPNSVGAGATISGAGTTCVTDQDFVMFAEGGPANQNGIFYYGPNQIQLPFGNGFRCVGGGTFRLPLVTFDSFNTAFYTVDWTVPPISSGPGAWIPGDDWNIQCWYRDPAGGGANFNFSDGLAITLGA